MTTYYGRSDSRALCVSLEHGGCGYQHVRPADDVDGLWEFDECDQCAEWAVRNLGWAANPQKVELTPDEVEQRERAEKEGSILTRQMAEAMATAAAQAVVTATPSTPAKEPAPKRATRARKSTRG